MNRTEKYLFIGLLVAVVLLCGSICGNVYQHYHFREVTQMMRTDTVTKRDTIYSERVDTVPQVVDENTVGYVKISDILLHVPYDVSKKGEKVDTLGVESGETASHMTDSLPIVQKTYADSTYTAYVSGIKHEGYPRLDSIRVRERLLRETVTVTQIQPGKQKHLGVGVTTGCGYGLMNKKTDVFVGVGITYFLWK